MNFPLGVVVAFIMASVAPISPGFAQTPNQYDDAQAAAVEILNRSLGSVNHPKSGPSQISPDSPVAKFLAFARGRAAILEPTQQQVCDAWKQMPPNQPFTGNFSVAGAEFSLDKMCGIKP